MTDEDIGKGCLGNRLMIKLIDDPAISKVRESIGLIVETDIAGSKLSGRGTVIGIGPCAFENWSKPWCKVGDVVRFEAYAGYLSNIDGEDYLFLNDDSIFYKFPKGALDD